MKCKDLLGRNVPEKEVFCWLFFFDDDLSDGGGISGRGVFSSGAGLGGGGGNGVDNVHTFDDLTKDDVVLRKVIVLVHDEELGAISVGAGVGHGNGATGVLASDRFIVKTVAGST